MNVGEDAFRRLLIPPFDGTGDNTISFHAKKARLLVTIDGRTRAFAPGAFDTIRVISGDDLVRVSVGVLTRAVLVGSGDRIGTDVYRATVDGGADKDSAGPRSAAT